MSALTTLAVSAFFVLLFEFVHMNVDCIGIALFATRGHGCVSAAVVATTAASFCLGGAASHNHGCVLRVKDDEQNNSGQAQRTTAFEQRSIVSELGSVPFSFVQACASTLAVVGNTFG